MFYIGCHLSFSGGYLAMGEEALSIDANTFQFFTRSPRGGKAKPLDHDDINNLLTLMETHKIDHVLAHAPYTMNACSDRAYTRDYAEELMKDDLYRMSFIPNSLYNFHPGSHVGQGVEKGIEMIIEMLNKVLTPEQETIVLLETMAGKGTEIGRSFDELQAIIEGVTLQDKIGVCWDTCHLYDAGYDLVNDLDGVIAEFDEKIGLDKLHAIHINDSKNHFKSHKDRHELIGQGSIGLDLFERLINHPKLKHLPFYLETPNDVPGYQKEIAMLRNLRK
ncbi:MAG TPA: deoxyribonuclease IV [Erysipelothrix sp.]